MTHWRQYLREHRDRPPAHGTREAKEFLVSMAGDILGSWYPAEAEPLERWLAAELDRDPREWSGCGACGSKEHNRRTCPVAAPTVDVRARVADGEGGEKR